MNIRRTLAFLAAAAMIAGVASCGDDSDEGGIEGGVGAEFTTPSDGDEVTSPVTVGMTAEGIDIVAVDDAEPTDGHFHIIVDDGCVEEGEVIPDQEDDERYYHYGDAATSDELELEPGEHDLCLQVGDRGHVAMDITHQISITVTD